SRCRDQRAYATWWRRRRHAVHSVSLYRSCVLRLVHDTDEVLHLGDHAADGRSVLQRGTTVHLVETQTDQRCTLLNRAADGAADLFDDNRLALLIGHWCYPYSSAATAAPRRA